MRPQYIPWFAASHQFAAVQHRDAVAARFGLVEMVSREQNGVTVVAKPRQVGEECVAAGRVERGGRFVEQ